MEWTTNFLVWLIIPFLSALLLLLHRLKSGFNKHLPPGPPGWPIFGNIFDLGTLPHQKLAGLRDTYGDVVWLNLGYIGTMVVQSSKAAAELFKNHDLSFSDRSIHETMRVHQYNESSLSLAPYGPYWRSLRRLVTVDMLTMKRINETVPIRRKCVDDLLLWIEEEARGMDGTATGLEFNMIGNLMLSRDLLDPQSRKGSEFFTAMRISMESSGHTNFADFFPWLKWLDPQGLKKRMEVDLGKSIEIASGFVKERMRQGRAEESKRKDFLDVLLEFQGDGKDEATKISEKGINIEMFMAASETTSSTMEWAMTELLRSPESMTKVKAELGRVIGEKRKLEESDLDDLPYLHAVVKETLRLHPAAPFLVPRRAVEDTKFMGYHIPKGTQVFVNVWAIGREAETWDDALCFKPERFVDSNMDYKGQNFEFIPFGAGRRICVGIPLAYRVLHFVLGSLLHHFDWQLERNVTPETMDMKERRGIVICKFHPLKAVPKIKPIST
ncbi:hypothetical protein VitviT2T_012614 [Vitis vinifera]|uniref:Cytochrome P450 76A2 n=1 Tax=Vitis vinifera TaxID=29760 RepID=A0ABY9CEB4_VITVI|nr:hypothetical protein VitviT2T_012614 [Vitis vinifera]